MSPTVDGGSGHHRPLGCEWGVPRASRRYVSAEACIPEVDANDQPDVAEKSTSLSVYDGASRIATPALDCRRNSDDCVQGGVLNDEGSGGNKLSHSDSGLDFTRLVEGRPWTQTGLAVCLEFVLQTTEADAEQGRRLGS